MEWLNKLWYKAFWIPVLIPFRVIPEGLKYQQIRPYLAFFLLKVTVVGIIL